MVYCVTNNFAQNSIAPEKIFKINFSLLNGYSAMKNVFDYIQLKFNYLLYVELVDNEMILSIYFLVDSFDAHISSSVSEISIEFSGTFYGDEKYFSVNYVSTGDVEMRELQLKRVF